MKIGPRYKIARRLGAGIFDKTQSVKFAQRSQNKMTKPKPKSEFGLQMLEKQKARFMYGITERKFKTYALDALAQKKLKADEALYQSLENRVDNVVYRMGLANSRAFARQLVSHGHITLNGKRITIPSIQIGLGDKIGIRAGSAKKKPFEVAEARAKEVSVPAWIKYDPVAKVAEIQGVPKYSPTETIFDVSAILEFYRR